MAARVQAALPLTVHTSSSATAPIQQAADSLTSRVLRLERYIRFAQEDGFLENNRTAFVRRYVALNDTIGPITRQGIDAFHRIFAMLTPSGTSTSMRTVPLIEEDPNPHPAANLMHGRSRRLQDARALTRNTVELENYIRDAEADGLLEQNARTFIMRYSALNNREGAITKLGMEALKRIHALLDPELRTTHLANKLDLQSIMEALDHPGHINRVHLLRQLQRFIGRSDEIRDLARLVEEESSPMLANLESLVQAAQGRSDVTESTQRCFVRLTALFKSGKSLPERCTDRVVQQILTDLDPLSFAAFSQTNFNCLRLTQKKQNRFPWNTWKQFFQNLQNTPFIQEWIRENGTPSCEGDLVNLYYFLTHSLHETCHRLKPLSSISPDDFVKANDFLQRAWNSFFMDLANRPYVHRWTEQNGGIPYSTTALNKFFKHLNMPTSVYQENRRIKVLPDPADRWTRDGEEKVYKRYQEDLGRLWIALNEVPRAQHAYFVPSTVASSFGTEIESYLRRIPAHITQAITTLELTIRRFELWPEEAIAIPLPKLTSITVHFPYATVIPENFGRSWTKLQRAYFVFEGNKSFEDCMASGLLTSQFGAHFPLTAQCTIGFKLGSSAVQDQPHLWTHPRTRNASNRSSSSTAAGAAAAAAPAVGSTSSSSSSVRRASSALPARTRATGAAAAATSGGKKSKFDDGYLQ